MKKLFGLLGFPLSHSFSKQYFTDKFEQQGLSDEFEYQNFELENLENLTSVIKDEGSLLGLNVTIPHKQTVIKYLDSLSLAARSIGAVNTIVIDRKKGIQLKGDNTDWIGFRTSLLKMIGENRPNALILGTGGSSKAVEYVLQSLKINYKFVSRTNSGANCTSYEDLTDSDISDSKLIINTTPLGMFPKMDFSPEINYGLLNNQHFLFDLIYNPDLTLFLKKGIAQGCSVKNGLEMLELQAEASWQIWNTSH